MVAGTTTTLCLQGPEGQKLRAKDHPFQHHHGKTRVRVLKVSKKNGIDMMHEYTVQTTLWSPVYDKVFTKGDNSDLVATDTQKNTVYVVAKRTAAETPEDFGLAIAAHLLKEYKMLTKVEVEVEEQNWERKVVDGVEHAHAWKKTSPCTGAALVTSDRKSTVVKSQIRKMTFIKTTQSGFTGYLMDKYTMLPECTERCLASELSSEWLHAPGTHKNFAATRTQVTKCIEAALFGPPLKGHYSPSLQNTIYDGACLVLETLPSIQKISIDTPNLHYLPAKFLSNFGEKFEDDVFIPTNEPSGTIFCEVSRGGK